MRTNRAVNVDGYMDQLLPSLIDAVGEARKVGSEEKLKVPLQRCNFSDQKNNSFIINHQANKKRNKETGDGEETVPVLDAPCAHA